MAAKRTIVLFVSVVFVLPFTAWALVNFYERRIEKLPVFGKTKEHHIEDFSLINQDGLTRTQNDWTAKIVVANFFFTHCPVICPKMTGNLKKVSKTFEKDKSIFISSFSIDPERDNVKQLKKYADKSKIETDNWDLLTGSKNDIYKLARNSFMIVATDGDGGPDDFIHSERLVLIDTQKRIRGYYNGTSDKETKQLISDIKTLKDDE
ncbi:MAG TPA: SCO family protein [Chitinophagaceae bacterium]|nr:SCO family protein [Chitinophagaceae bacterium]